MAMHRSQAYPCQNQLVSQFSDQLYQSLIPLFDIVESKVGDELHRQGEPIKYLYFPCNGVYSTMKSTADGSAFEAGTIGNETFIGMELLLNAEVASQTVVCQIAGSSLRMHVKDFMRVIDAQPTLRHILLKSIHGFLAQSLRNRVCSHFHSVEMRFARCLLISQDRVQKDEFNLTQESIASMLGSYEPDVSSVAGRFQQSGIIRYTRCKMQILERARLEEASCECYALVRNQYERILGVTYRQSTSQSTSNH